MRAVVLASLVLAACVEANTVPCGDVLCPAGDVCTDGGCATEESAAACAGAPDGRACSFGAVTFAACVGGACREVVCGDGVRVGPEACDDGNTAAGDGCSPACDSAEVCGNGVIDSFLGEQCDDGGVRGLSGDGCASTCKIEVGGWTDVSPVPIAARGGHAMAYDAARGTVVMFGGYTTTDLLADTWVWSGGGWIRRAPLTSPPARSGHAMAYDAKRGVTLLFGGKGANGELADTWAWDGTNWTELHPTDSPAARAGHAMAYDSTRQIVVLVGGAANLAAFGDTWEWEGTAWKHRFDVGSPGQVVHPYMAADLAQSIVLYGGNEARATWIYDGVEWQFVAANGPGVSDSGGMASLPGGGVLLFGGLANNARSSEAWTFSTETQWKKITAGLAPDARSDTALAIYPPKVSVILFGGALPVTSSTSLDGQTWTFDTIFNWQHVVPAQVAPTPRRGGGMVYDALTGRALLFGGVAGATYQNDVWEWDDRGWTRRTVTGPLPQGRSDAAVAYDTLRARLVVFGGAAPGGDPGAGGKRADTWEWSGTGWSAITVTSPPPVRDRAAVAYDPLRGETVMFGGRAADNAALADTWVWNGATWAQRAPATSPPAREGARMAFDPVRQRLVMFGGRQPTTEDRGGLGDTWEWDGATWTAGPEEAAAARSGHGMVYDAHLQRVVIYGGTDFGPRGDAWAYDGVAWTPLVATTTVPLRSEHAMAYDAVQRAIVAFGGESLSGNALGDTIIYRQTSPFERSERCALATDDIDGDGLTGCDDPDCWGRCTPLCPAGVTCAPDAMRCGDGVCGGTEDSLICPGDCP